MSIGFSNTEATDYFSNALLVAGNIQKAEERRPTTDKIWRSGDSLEDNSWSVAIPKEGTAVWGRRGVFTCFFCKMKLSRIIRILTTVQEIIRISCLWGMGDGQPGKKENQSKRSQGHRTEVFALGADSIFLYWPELCVATGRILTPGSW